jgi:hypothetical protein
MPAFVPLFSQSFSAKPGRPLLRTLLGRTQISGRPQKPILVSSQAIEQLYELVPGWEKYMLEHNYIAWAKTLEPARNEDARFLCWV